MFKRQLFLFYNSFNNFQKYFINVLLKVKCCVLKENKDLPCIESSSLLSLGVPCKYREIIMSINQGEKNPKSIV